VVRYCLNFGNWKLRKTVAANLHASYQVATVEESEIHYVEVDTNGDGLSVNRGILTTQLPAYRSVLPLPCGNLQSNIHDQCDRIYQNRSPRPIIRYTEENGQAQRAQTHKQGAKLLHGPST